MDSNIYAAATLLDVGKIKDWNNKSFSDALKLKALNCLPEIGDQMINTRNDTVQATTNQACTSASVSASAAQQIKEKTADDDFDFYFDNSDSEPESGNIIFISKKVAIAEETKRFKNLLANSKSSVSTKDPKKNWVRMYGMK